ncbi:MAG: hypothetical protein ACOYOK_16390 [Pseudobdellovibrionaceae bacterium]
MKHLLITYLLLALASTGFAQKSVNQAAQNNSATEVLLKASNDFSINAADVDNVERVAYKNFATDVKVFSYSGGDPAFNGTYLNLAVFADMQTGWLVFELGNIRSYQVAPITKDGFLKIHVEFEDLDQEGNIHTQKAIYFLDINNALKNGTIKIQR